MERVKWVLCEFKWILIRVLHILTGVYFISERKYGMQDLMSAEEGNKSIENYIESGNSFAYCRYGYVELGLMIQCERSRLLGINMLKHKNNEKKMFCISEEDVYVGIEKFDGLMRRASIDADILGVWTNLAMGDVYVSFLLGKNRKCITTALALESYCFEQPWTSALKNKKVLVVSPFSKEIESQYKNNRTRLFKNPNVLPEFELQTMDSVWYIADYHDNRFSNWFEAYEYLCNEVHRRKFDIALLGCGPFGFPLAVEIKRMGRQAIQMGGAIQILFGIRGKRWDTLKISELYNDFWIRPIKENIPQGAEILDGQCYW